MSKTRGFVLAVAVAAMAFTFSCSGDDGSDGKDGAPGSVVTIGADGYLYIDGVNTGIKAGSEPGMPGVSGSVVTIGASGNWLIDGVDTGVKAAGTPGTPGTPGASCVSEDGGAYLVIKCGGVIQDSLPKAMCGLDAYDPKTQFCDSRNLQLYTSVKIGEHTWMKENLNYDAPDSKCYNDSLSNCAKYGRLYSWEAAAIVCPTGWHLPGANLDEEWDALIEFAGGADSSGIKLKAASGWNNLPTALGSGTDDYGFSALPAGMSGSRDFDFAGTQGYWWTSTDAPAAPGRPGVAANMTYNSNSATLQVQPKSTLLSVRCVKDN